MTENDKKCSDLIETMKSNLEEMDRDDIVIEESALRLAEMGLSPNDIAEMTPPGEFEVRKFIEAAQARKGLSTEKEHRILHTLRSQAIEEGWDDGEIQNKLSAALKTETQF